MLAYFQTLVKTMFIISDFVDFTILAALLLMIRNMYFERSLEREPFIFLHAGNVDTVFSIN